MFLGAGHLTVAGDDGCGDHLPGVAPAPHPAGPVRGDPHPAHSHLHGPRLQVGASRSPHGAPRHLGFLYC